MLVDVAMMMAVLFFDGDIGSINNGGKSGGESGEIGNV